MPKKASFFITKWLSILILIFSVTSCSQKKPLAYVKTNIEAEHNQQFIISNFWFADTSSFKHSPHTQSIPIEAPCYFTLRTQNSFANIFLAPKNLLEVETNGLNSFDSLTFSNALHAENTYLQLKKKKCVLPKTSFNYLLGLNPQDLSAAIDSIASERTAFLSQFINNHPTLNPLFLNYEKQAIAYNLAQLKLEYAILSASAYDLDASFFNFIDTIKLNDSILISQPEYSQFISTYAEWLMHKEIIEQSNISLPEISLIKMQIISRNFVVGAVKNFLLYNTLNQHITYHGLKNTELLFRTFEFQCSNTILKQKLTQPFESYLTLNNHGMAPEVGLIDMNNESVLLSNFKGSYLFIDVWATWCTPCLRESPEFEKLSQQYAHKNIVFLSLSVDDAQDKWRQFCLKNQKNNNQLWVVNKQAFLNDYMINTIPRFIIIDPDGRIVEVDANRPSENKNQWLNGLPDKAAI